MTTIKVDKITPGSGTTTTLGDSGDTFTIPAGVTFTNSGSTNLGDQLTYCTTTKSASFTTVANKGYFINTSDASPFLNYAVTVASGTLYSVGGTGNAYFLDGSRNMALTLLKGRTYRFTQSDNTNDSHPLIISTSNSTTLSTFIAGIVSSGITYYLDGSSNQSDYHNTTTFNAATTRYIEFQPQTTGTFYFGCYIHGVQMGGAITSEELTVTLPSSPTVGTEMIIIDSTGNASTNNIVIGRGGSKIKGGCNDALLDKDRIGVRLIYSDASQGWVTVTSANETAPALNTTTFMSASGGNTTITCGNYKTHIFTADGTFTVSSASNTAPLNVVDYIVVAGGAGGGSNNYGGGSVPRGSGGGGAGGFRIFSTACGSNSPLNNSGASPNTSVTISGSPGSYPITIGAGGAGAPSGSPDAGSDGNNSVFSTVTSALGGKGGGHCNSTAGAGGSGGGGRNAVSGGAGNTPPVAPPQGNPGGDGGASSGTFNGSGGGGAGSAGSDGDPSGVGGAGSYIANPFIGPTAPSYGTAGPVSSTRYFAGGGAGSPGPGGAVSGGDGGGGPKGTAGTTNTGGGGGANSPGTGGAGGSGIVMIRYKYQ
jgi:hypothetical protein